MICAKIESESGFARFDSKNESNSAFFQASAVEYPNALSNVALSANKAGFQEEMSFKFF